MKDHPELGALPLGQAKIRLPRRVRMRITHLEQALKNIPREELSPAALWLEDHARFLQENAVTLQRELRRAPRVPSQGGEACIVRLMRGMVEDTQGRITRDDIEQAVAAYQKGRELTQDELMQLPLALRAVLFSQMEPCIEQLWHEVRVRRDAKALAKNLSDGKAAVLPEDSLLLERTIVLLTDSEDAAALSQVDALLQPGEKNADSLARIVHEQMMITQQKLSRAILSLHATMRMPWPRMQEKLSAVCGLLRSDSTYPGMDEDSRAYYARRVSHIAHSLHVSEMSVARAALALAGKESGIKAEAGFYLIEDVSAIKRYLLKGGRAHTPGRRQAVFCCALYALAAVSLAVGIFFGAPWYTLLPLVVCASEVYRMLVYGALRRRLPPRLLPRMAVKALTPETRTLVVIPTLLLSEKHALKMARQLTVLRCANEYKHLDFMLLGDFADAPAQALPDDEIILHAASAGIDALNEAYGGGFYYLHRKRMWNVTERRYMGRERKRGALEMLNRLLIGEDIADTLLVASADIKSLKDRYRYVITLDADTFLPPGGALKLVGTMEHPLQKDRVTVVQPRMCVMADTVKTRAQLYLGGRGGADAYNMAAQDVYQDTFGRGSFVGKGIYQPEAWLHHLDGRVPHGRLLSHDLYEGEVVGSAMAEDITFYDGHPARLIGWRKRLHRWTRGDWQLLPFLMDRRLSLLSRHKIWDNMRRSILPVFQILLLLMGTALGNIWLCLLALPWPLRGMPLRLFLLPAKAETLVDALVRAVYRQFVSHRNLLNWVTAAQSEGESDQPLAPILTSIACGTALIVFSLLPGGFLPSVAVGLLWVVFPLVAPLLDKPISEPAPLTPDMRAATEKLAQDTWRFFEKTVNETGNFLPPDNLQMEPDRGIAYRTSPTNIGMYLLSCVAAHELKFIDADQMGRRFDDTLSTLEKMEHWHGHLYNWYDTRTLRPLTPCFVSSVDSGNLAACLLTCAQAARQAAGQMDAALRSLALRFDALFARMDLTRLYDAKERLFYVGYDVMGEAYSHSHYDLLASEARLLSFVAVMTHQAPLKHWYRMGRAVTRAGGGATLLSWGGTMFEYLMPALLLPHTRGTLLGESCYRAIAAQMSHRPDRPWGISECGYAAFDPQLNYQYKAFGLPALSFSGETRGQVIAPYASMLALPFYPRSAGANLLRMQKLNWTDDMGLIEAVDYAPQRVDKAPRLVMSHMAHHQGMVLCAACNALNNQALVKMFSAMPRVQAYTYLLTEPAPRKAARLPQSFPMREEDPGATFPPRTARTGLPVDAHVMQSGGMTWLMTAQGQGYLAHQGTFLTRFSPGAGAQNGMQLYVRDGQAGEYFRPSDGGEARFEVGAVQFEAQKLDIHVRQTCFVTPLTDMAVAILEIENLAARQRELEVVSYLSVALGSMQADAAHPAFRDLSIHVDGAGEAALIASRRPRSARDEAPHLLHAAVGEFTRVHRQGSRAAFIGGRGSYRHPMALQGEAALIPEHLGDVITPGLSLRCAVRVPAQGTARVAFVTAACSDREKAEHTLRTLPTLDALRPMAGLACTQARITTRYLRMDARMLTLYQRMLGALVFSGQPHQQQSVPASRSALWRYGIAGDLPVFLVSFPDQADRTLIKHALRAHAWYHMQGIWVDLIFFCNQVASYERPTHDAITQLIAGSHGRELMGIAGGVHLVEGDAAALKELSGLSRLWLQGGRPLGEQLNALASGQALSVPPAFSQPALPPAPRLMEWNGVGGFDEAGAYVVLGQPPMPWSNILCNERFGTLVCERGILQSYCDNSRLRRITRPAQDVVTAPSAEEIYLCDNEGGVYPLCGGQVTHEAGVTTYRTVCGAIQCDLKVFTDAQLTLGLRTLTLRAEEVSDVTVLYAVRFALGEREDLTFARCEKDSVIAVSGEMEGIVYMHLPLASARVLSASAYDGLDGTALPQGLFAEGTPGGQVGVLALPVSLRAKEPQDVMMMLGYAQNTDEMVRDIAATLPETSQQLVRETRSLWALRLNGLMLFCNDTRLSRMINLWLPYQTRASRLWARMGLYQAGGAFGFRDQLQDMLGLLHTEPELAREHLLLCAAHQFEEGDVQHWWHMPRAGVRTRISDNLLFMPYILAQYVLVTGDTYILQVRVPYLSSAPLESGEDDRYESPDVSAESGTMMEHCLRALDAVRLGAHGLPLMGAGDWNDGMNAVGGTGGESVWLGFFYAMALKDFSALCDADTKERLTERRRAILNATQSAWTGKWYLRAWYDGGEELGGPGSDPARIDLISQCFAVLAGAPRMQAREALEYAYGMLFDRQHGLVKLLWPPFSQHERAGYITAYVDGVRENGGQYTHAVPWLVMALVKLGQVERAWEVMRAVMPAAHSDTPQKVAVYQVEPYVMAADVYAAQNAGRGGWTWYTGSAAWMYYVLVTVLLGFEKRGERVRLTPSVPPGYEEYTFVYRYGSSTYQLTAARDALFVTLDGERQEDGWAVLTDDGRTHEARFPLR